MTKYQMKKNKEEMVTLKKNNLKSSFEHEYIKAPGGIPFAAVRDLDTEGCMSVTNDIENIAQTLDVCCIVYLDSMKVWSFWSVDLGYKSLHYQDETGNPVPPDSLENAIDVAVSKKYFK